MVERLLQVPIWNLLFEPEPAGFEAAHLLPDPQVRTRLDALLAQQRLDRARGVRDWLNQPR